MRRWWRLFLAVLALGIASQPLHAHGTETHDGNAAETSQAPDGQPMVSTGESVAAGPEQPDADRGHDGDAASMWTKLHPATVHFPIALLLMAALTELAVIWRPAAGLTNAVRVMAWGGAAGAALAALFGWIHTGIWLGGEATMQWHRWTGTGLAVIAPVAALFSAREHRLPFRVLIFAIAATLLAQGYWGAELAHGPHHLGL